MEYRVLLLVVTLLCTSAEAENLPSYIKPCQYNQPDFNKCALENAKIAIPHIVKGDKHLKIPPLNPLKIPVIDVQQDNFKLTLKDVDVFGLDSIQLKSLHLNKTHIDAVFRIDVLNIIGKYSTDGKVLLLTLKGEGPANLTAVGGDYAIKSTFEPYTKNGETYLKFNKPTVQYKLERAYFDFGNLLNGDEKLGPEINNLLNENWESVLKDLGVPIEETVASIIESIVSKIIDNVSEKQVFLE